MKYFAASLLIAGAVAQTFDPAQAVKDLTTATNGVKSQVDAYTGGDGASLKQAAASLTQQIQTDNQALSSVSAITQDQALGLAGPVQDLGTAAKSAIDAIVAKKQTFVSNGQGSNVYSALAAQASASNEFSTNLANKVPEGLRGIAANLAAPISSALASGVSAFQDVASATGGASSATSAASSAASASASATGSSSAAVVTMTSGSSSTATESSSPIVTGGANTAVVGSGVAAIAFLAALAL